MFKYNPINLFATNTVASRFWFSLFLIFAIWSVIQPYLIIYAYRVDEKIMLLDHPGTIHVTPAISLNMEQEKFEYIIRFAVGAIIDRNPTGADHPKLLKQMFSEEANHYVNSLIKSESQLFKKNSFHQKAEIFEIKMWEGPKDTLIASVTGQLIRTGGKNGRKVTDGGFVRINLTLGKNPSMKINQIFPYIIQKVDYRVRGLKK